MRAIKTARKLIEANPADPAAKTLARLVLALASEEPFKLADIYALDGAHFDLAMDILKDWRLDRYYMGKAKLFDLSWQVGQMQAGES
ncbi:MAG: hypothetical protein AB7P37_11195 [Ramlibacter sp.]